jgi:hypothetical protein
MSYDAFTPSTPDDRDRELEARADELLWQSGTSPRYLEYSFYREHNLNRAMRQDRHQVEEPPPDVNTMRETAGQLLEALLAEVALEWRHRRVLAMARRGLNHRQIATAMGIRNQTARRWHLAALRRLRAYCEARCRRDADTNLMQVYLEQLRVGVYRPEGHCNPGREDCQRTGICPHRWYLYRDENAES